MMNGWWVDHVHNAFLGYDHLQNIGAGKKLLNHGPIGSSMKYHDSMLST